MVSSMPPRPASRPCRRSGFLPEHPGPPISAPHFRATPVSHLILYAFDAVTGKQLYSSKDIIKDWTHFNAPTVALGKVFIVTHDAHVYAFGL